MFPRQSHVSYCLSHVHTRNTFEDEFLDIDVHEEWFDAIKDNDSDRVQQILDATDEYVNN